MHAQTCSTVPVIEECEARILYSADMQALLTASAEATLSAMRGETQMRHEIVFIDSAVAGYAQLAESIAAAPAGFGTREVIVLDSERDGISTLSAILGARRDLDAIHIISHGEPGTIHIGDSRLNLDNLPQNAVAISGWGDALAAHGDILLYGCAVAGNAAGEELLRELGLLTGADIAASTDLTGSAAAGGNWMLEYQSGRIQTRTAADANTQAAWPGLLASYAVTSTADSGMGSLRQAIIDANGHPGTDTIVFDIGAGTQLISPSSALPRITDTVTLDGSTQTGYAGKPLITLDGAATRSGHGLVFDTGSAGSALTGLDIRHFSWDGVDILGVSDIAVQGNRIEANAGAGILVFGNAANLRIGGAANGNVIADNGGAGIVVYSANASAIQISENAIAGNGGLGIDLGRADGVSQNDAADQDGGPNGMQNFPVLSSATQSDTQVAITGSLGSNPSRLYRLEFFSSAVQDASGHGEGERFLGAAAVQTDNAGRAAFQVTLPAAFAAGEWISATATDQAVSETSEFSHSIMVNQSHLPVGADSAVSMPEDSTYIFSAAEFGFSDADGDRLAAVRIATLTGAGMLYWNGAPARAGDLITRADLDHGRFTFKAEQDAVDESYASFDFQVQDDGLNNLDPSARRMTIAVLPVNDAPAGADTTVTAREDTAYRFTAADFGFSDRDGNMFTSLLISALPEAGELRIAGTQAHAGDQLPVTDIDAGRLTYVAAENASGDAYAVFRFQVGDDGGTDFGGIDLDPQPRIVQIDVAPVNDAPAGTDGIIDLFESQAHVFVTDEFGFADTEKDGLLTVFLAGVPATGTLASGDRILAPGDYVSREEIEQGQLIFTPGESKTEVFGFYVKDDGGVQGDGKDMSARPNTITLRIAPVNHAPTGSDKSIQLNEDALYVLKAEDFGFSDSDGDAFDAVSFTTLPAAGRLSLNDQELSAGSVVTKADIDLGRLLYAPAAEQHGSPYASLTFQVKDDGGSAHGGHDRDASSRILTFNVAAIGDAPDGKDQTLFMKEDTAYILQAADFGFVDPDGDALAGVRILSLPMAGTLLLHGSPVAAGEQVDRAAVSSGELVFIPVADHSGSAYASFAFAVIDSSNAALFDPTPNKIVINVAAVYDPPAIELPAGGQIYEGGAVAFDTAGGNRIHVKNDDAGATSRQITLTVDHGTLTLGTQTASTVTMSGTITDIETALADLRYMAPVAYSGAVELRISLMDGSNAGKDGTIIAERTFGFLLRSPMALKTDTTPASDGTAQGAGSAQTGASATGTGSSGAPASAGSAARSATQATQVAKGRMEDLLIPVAVAANAHQQAAMAESLPMQTVVTAKADAGAAQLSRISMPAASSPEQAAAADAASQQNVLTLDALFQKAQRGKLNLLFNTGISSSDGKAGEQAGGVTLSLNGTESAGSISAQAIEATGILISLGTMWLFVGKGALLTSLFAGMPAWQRIDPLHVIAGGESTAGNDDDSMAGIADDLFGAPGPSGAGNAMDRKT